MQARALVPKPISQFGADVRAGLARRGQKELPSKYLYDDVGSALFEVISLLPEYGLTRADERLLKNHAREVAGELPSSLMVAELGSGSGKKTRYILEALSSQQSSSSPVAYYPIEISTAALAMCERELSDLECVSVLGYEREYRQGLKEVASRRGPGEHILVLFLGSTIGNFERPADIQFLREVRRILQPGDALLLGADLEKPLPQLLAAYDDPLGVTAAFNLNLLTRLNRELGADFALDRFRHTAKFNPASRSMEMHIESLCEQTVSIPAANLQVDFAKRETIWTESSHKYSRNELMQAAFTSGFRCRAQWIDAEWPFAENLWVVE